jgi:hypothetical protein
MEILYFRKIDLNKYILGFFAFHGTIWENGRQSEEKRMKKKNIIENLCNEKIM